MTREEAKALADRVLALSKSADQTRVNITQHLERQYALRRREHHDVRRHHRRRRRGDRDDRATSRFCLDQRARRREPEAHGRSRRSACSPVAGRSRADAGARTAEPCGRERLHRRHRQPDTRSPRRRGAPRRLTARAAARFSRPDFSTCTPMPSRLRPATGCLPFTGRPTPELSMTARTPDGTGSGWASAGSRDWGKIDPAAIGRAAARKAESSRNPQAIDARPMTAVLEPQAVNDLVPLLSGSLNARAADEGRSAFSKARRRHTNRREGDGRARDALSPIPPIPICSPMPFDVEGFPLKRTVWIEKGVLRNLSYTRFWAQQQKMPPTGTNILRRHLERDRRRIEDDRRHEDHRRADRRLRARRARDPLSSTFDRSSRGPCSTRASPATARFSSKKARSRGRSRTCDGTKARC